MGQAVATAAYLCKKYDATPREIGSDYIDELQQMLLKDGISIPNVYNHDKLDLALSATVTADSFVKNGKPENVINGKTRPTDGESYCWISESGLPQSITLNLKSTKEISEIRITFDIPFDKYRYAYQPQPELTNLVSGFYAEIMSDGKWIKIADVADNIQRLVTLKFDSIKASKVRITFKSAINSDFAVISEIRVY